MVGRACRRDRAPRRRRQGPRGVRAARRRPPPPPVTPDPARCTKGPPHMKTIDHWIGGKPAEGTSGAYGPVFDPATGAQTKRVAFASADEVDHAVAAARAASATWSTA